MLLHFFGLFFSPTFQKESFRCSVVFSSHGIEESRGNEDLPAALAPLYPHIQLQV